MVTEKKCLQASFVSVSGDRNERICLWHVHARVYGMAVQWLALSPRFLVEIACSPHVHIGDSKLPVVVSVYGCLSFHVSPAMNCTLPSWQKMNE